MDTYFIGYDAREHEAAAVCVNSIRRWTKNKSKIYLLEHRTLRRMGLFSRDWEIDKNGQYMDKVDGRPFSTEFSHSRFLVFELAMALGITDSCMFVDCDWLFRTDPGALMKAQAKTKSPISCCMAERSPSTDIKMDGMIQTDYSRKLWSALFTFTPSQSLADAFKPMSVNSETGRNLHQFMGIADSQFTDIPIAWSYVPSLDEPVAYPNAYHYSEWSPWINPDKEEAYPNAFREWREARRRTLEAASDGILLKVDNLEDAYLNR